MERNVHGLLVLTPVVAEILHVLIMMEHLPLIKIAMIRILHVLLVELDVWQLEFVQVINLNLFVKPQIQLKYLLDVLGIQQPQLVDKDNALMEHLQLMNFVILGLQDVRLQELYVLVQTLDVMYLQVIQNSA